MAQFRKFSGLRTYTVPLQRDMRELERYLEDLDERVARLVGSESLGLSAEQEEVSTLTAHAKTHATKIDAKSGSDPLDIYYMKWRKKQVIQPDLAAVSDVPLQIKPSSSSQTGDMLNVFDKESTEALTITNVGLAAFGAAPEQSRVNIKHGGAPISSDPETVGTPYIWFRADDITGVTNGNNTSSNAVPERTGNFPNGWVMQGGGTQGVIYYSGDGGSGLNGHAWVAQAATPTRLNLSSTDDSESGFVDFDGFTVLAVFSALADIHENWVIGRKRNQPTTTGLAAPLKWANAKWYFYTDGDQDQTDAGDLSGDEWKIMIVRREAASSTVKAYGSVSSDTAAEWTSATNSGTVHFDALFTGGAGEADPGFGLAEVIVYDTYLSDAEVLQLYQWAAGRFGLTQLTSGGGGDLLECFDADDNTAVIVEEDGRLVCNMGLKLTQYSSSPVDTRPTPSADTAGEIYRVKDASENEWLETIIEDSTGSYKRVIFAAY